MPEKWTGDLLGKMHCERIGRTDLARELGVTKAYVTMILNGNRKPEGIQQRMEEAVEAIIRKKHQ